MDTNDAFTYDTDESDMSDSDLVHLCQGAESRVQAQAAFAMIYRRHCRGILNFCASRLREADMAEDAASKTWIAAFESLPSLRNPESLRSWLFEIARRRCLEEWTRQNRLTTSEPPLHLSDPNDHLVESAIRKEEVLKLLQEVVASIPSRNQRVFFASVIDEMPIGLVAAQLGIRNEQASRIRYKVKKEMSDGFGALVLAREGRPYCQALADILDSAAAESLDASTMQPVFTAKLRQRLVHHVGTCPTCDDCRRCRDEQKRIVGSYAPVLIPIIIAAGVSDSVQKATGVDLSQVDFTSEASTGSSDRVVPDTRPSSDRITRSRSATPRRRRRRAAAFMLLLLLLLGGVTYGLFRFSQEPKLEARRIAPTSNAADRSRGSIVASIRPTRALLANPYVPENAARQSIRFDIEIGPATLSAGTVATFTETATYDLPGYDYLPGGVRSCAGAPGTGTATPRRQFSWGIGGEPSGVHLAGTEFVILLYRFDGARTPSGAPQYVLKGAIDPASQSSKTERLSECSKRTTYNERGLFTVPNNILPSTYAATPFLVKFQKITSALGRPLEPADVAGEIESELPLISIH